MNATDETTNTAVIPAEDELKPQSRSKSWRLAGGELVRGRESDGSVERRANNRVYGLVKRIGIHDGRGRDDDKAYRQIEVEVEHPSEGPISVHAGLLNIKGELAPGVSAVSLAESLLRVNPGDLIVVSAYLGNAQDATKRPTICKISKVDPLTKALTDIERPYNRGDKRTTLQRWADLEPQIRAHALYAERPASDDVADDGTPNTHLAALCRFCMGKGWPAPDQAPGEWLGMVATFFEHPARATLASYSDDEWGEVRQAFEQAPSMPGALAPALRRMQNGKPANASAFAPAAPATVGHNAAAFGAKEYDPFNE